MWKCRVTVIRLRKARSHWHKHGMGKNTTVSRVGSSQHCHPQHPLGYSTAVSTYAMSFVLKFTVGRDTAVGIATRYGLGRQGIESRCGGEIFRTRPDRPWGPPSLLYNGYQVFHDGKAAGAWRLPPTQSSAEVKERVQLSTPLWAFVACYTVNFVY